MSINTTEGLQSCSPSEGSIESTVETLIEIVEEQAERIDELKNELDEHRERSAKDRAETRRRVTDIEKDIEQRDDTHACDACEGAETGDPNPTPHDDESATQTALFDVCRLPNDVAQRELSANQRRARFVAKDIADYATSVPAGYAITSSEISTVLRAGTDCKGRTQTTARVMNFLDRFGEDSVKVVQRRGTKRVILDEELVNELDSVTPVETDNHGRRYGTGVGVP